METLTDDSLMPYGVHKGTPMADVPATYLMWLYENKKATKSVLAYILDNMQVLKKEIGEAWPTRK